MMVLRPVLLAAVAASLACTLDAGGGDGPLVSEPTRPVEVLPVNVLPLRIWDDPYEGVDWRGTLRLLAQTHDHVGTRTAAIMAYDSAGYQVLPIMDYSGVASLTYAKRTRLWPAEAVLSTTARTTARNVTTWVPGAEEVGYQHIISLFLTEYIAKWEPAQYPSRQPWMYGTGQEAIDYVRARGGFPILAHPWGPVHWNGALQRYGGIEIYSAYAEQRFLFGEDPFYRTVNRNQDLMAAWDRVLQRGELVIGFAVNDHFGPDSKDTTLSPRVRDSGKSEILATDTSLAAVRAAVTAGRVFAVRDFGVPKRQYARIDSIWSAGDMVHVSTTGTVRWVADGRVIAEGPRSLAVSAVPTSARYLRAEVHSADGSVVYAQPVRLRPRGDANGDGMVDRRDALLCAPPQNATLSQTMQRACEARLRDGLN